jgi:hypothetical protein
MKQPCGSEIPPTAEGEVPGHVRWSRCHNLAANMWRLTLAHDPQALDGINPILTALNAIATASGNATPVTPDLDLDVDGIPMLHGSLLLLIHILDAEATRARKTLAEVLDEYRNHFIDGSGQVVS